MEKQTDSVGWVTRALTVVAVLVDGGEVDGILQQHGADGGHILLGSQVQRSLPVFGQLVHFGAGQELDMATHRRHSMSLSTYTA